MDRLDTLKLFVAIADEGGFSAAARQLGLSRSAASRQIMALEDRLGVQLMNRSTRSLSLTEAGITFLERARSVLGDLEEAERAVSDLGSAPRGRLSVNAPMSFGIRKLAPAVADFMLAYPDLHVALMLNDRFVDPYEEGYDLTLRIGELAVSELVARRIAPVARLIVAAPAYLATHGEPKSPADLKHHRALHYGQHGVRPAWRLTTAEGFETVPVVDVLSSNNGDVLLAAARAGAGIALLPDFIVEDDLAAGRLVRVLPGAEPPPIALHAVYPPGRYRPAKLRLFVDFLMQRFARRDPALTQP